MAARIAGLAVDDERTMKNALVIAGKELQSYFVQPVAYVVMAVFLLLAGWFFFSLLSRFDQILQIYIMMHNVQALERVNLNTMVVAPMLHDLAIVLVILVPAITMRAFAEEKRTGTYELLLTAPVRTGEVVAGKFIAAACFVLGMIVLSGVYAVILALYGNPEAGVMASGYLGLGLLGVCFVGVGLFTSSLTTNQIIAAISCFGALLLLYVISWPAEAAGAATTAVLRYLSLPEHFDRMTQGLIDSRDLVYLLSLVGVALFLTQRSVESARWR